MEVFGTQSPKVTNVEATNLKSLTLMDPKHTDPYKDAMGLVFRVWGLGIILGAL